MPIIGFSPDADFPCIYSEKALLTVYTEQQYIENEKIRIKEIDCQNNRINVVPKYCSVKLEVNSQIADELKKLLLQKVSDEIDRKLLETMIVQYGGRAVGIEALAVSIGEEIDTIEDVYEPYLLQLGYLQRTPRGRIVTERGYQHFGIPYTEI